jgi:hypothetical protein
VRRREGRRRSKESEALAHGFDGEGSNSPRYWIFSNEESLSIWRWFSRGKKGSRERRFARHSRPILDGI